MIDNFHGKYSFLSNFYNFPFYWNFVLANTAEHHFQAAKAELEEDRDWVYESVTPGQAKRRGRSVTCRSDWQEVKVDFMRDILEVKFSIPELRGKLIETGDQELVEGNTWGDTFWGVCNGVGENWLGKLLMEIRDA